MPVPPDPLSAARWYVGNGLSVIPVRADGSKQPEFVGWRQFSDRVASDDELVAWFGGARTFGVGVVPGPASGNLVVLDFECKGSCAFAEWLTGLDRTLAAHLTACPIVRTPTGGRHVWVRLPDSQPGTVLARYASKKTKVEIRGRGHQVLAPGCPRECHPSGELYTFESEGWLQ
jgi:hypothetical protein